MCCKNKKRIGKSTAIHYAKVFTGVTGIATVIYEKEKGNFDFVSYDFAKKNNIKYIKKIEII